MDCIHIFLFFTMVVKKIVGAEDDDDVALAKIDNLFFRTHRRASTDDAFEDSNSKSELETKLRDLSEFAAGPTAAKWPVVREDIEEETETNGISTSEVSPFVRFDPVDQDDEAEGTEEFADFSDEEDNEMQDNTKNPAKMKSKHAALAHRMGQKLIDRNIKFTISLPVAIVAVGSIILLTCCCSLYLRNRLIACINALPGRKTKKKSKMLVVDTERGRSTPRGRKRREKSLSLSKRRARSLSQDVVNIGTQKSATTTKDMEEPSQTTGCYQCCRKKKTRGNKTRK